MRRSKANKIKQHRKILSIIVLSISISILFNPSFVFGGKDNGKDNDNDKEIDGAGPDDLFEQLTHPNQMEDT